MLFANFGQEDALYLMPIIARLRRAGVRCELYPEPSQIKKQMSYADSLPIPYVVLVGEEERLSGRVTLKDMCLGEQKTRSEEELLEYIYH